MKSWFLHMCRTGNDRTFYFGTTHATTEMEALRSLTQMWEEIIGHMEEMTVLAVIPGCITINPE